MQPHYQKPATCLTPTTDFLKDLPQSFDALPLFSPDNFDQLHALLRQHAEDGADYLRDHTELTDCQAFIRSLP